MTLLLPFGIGNIANAGGSAIARLLGGWLIDTINRVYVSQSAGYMTLYYIAAGLFICSFFAILPLKTKSKY